MSRENQISMIPPLPTIFGAALQTSFEADQDVTSNLLKPAEGQTFISPPSKAFQRNFAITLDRSVDRKAAKMDSAGSPQKPRSSAQHQSQNGTPLQQAPVSSTERQKLVTSIESSRNERHAIDLEAPQHYSQFTGDDSHLNKITLNGRPRVPPRLSGKPRDPRDEKKHGPPPSASRPASPYTRNPPIDFDGLSWPSKLLPRSSVFSLLKLCKAWVPVSD